MEHNRLINRINTLEKEIFAEAEHVTIITIGWEGCNFQGKDYPPTPEEIGKKIVFRWAD